MALSDPYATVEEYSVRTPKQTTADDDAILRELTAVSRYLDKALGRTLGFQKDEPESPATSVARIYESPSRGTPKPGFAEAENPWKASGMSRTLDIDDHVSIASVYLDEGQDGLYSTLVAATDYELLPRNATLMPEPQPYRQIRLLDNATTWAWSPAVRIRVSGIGGWPAVPAAIRAATIELTAILRIESTRATNRINEVGQVLSTSRDARDIVTNLARTYMTSRSYL